MASLHFINGTFWSGENSSAHSLLVENGIIEELDPKNPPQDAISIDLEGSFIMPAFGDGHAHPMFAGRESQGPQVTELPTLEETLRQIKLFADKHPNESWIVGGAYDAALVPR